MNNFVLATALFGGLIWPFVIVLVVAAIAFLLLVFVKFEVVYVDPDTDYEIAHEKVGFGTKVNLSSAKKTGKKLVGWAFDEKGKSMVKKSSKHIWRTTELFAVWEKDVSTGVTLEDANAVLEISYMDDLDGKEIEKDIQPLSIAVPEKFDDGSVLLGWALEPGGEPVLTSSVNEKSVFTLELYPVYVNNEADAAPAEEEAPAEEAPAEEAPVEEAPVEETPAEEAPVEEVEEVPAEEEAPAEEAPVEEAPAEEAAPEDAAAFVAPVPVGDENNTLEIKYSRSFTANIIQADDVVKGYYNELKNHILSYKRVKSKISWKFDSFNRGRDQVAKIKLRGKTVCVYCAIDANLLEESRFHQDQIDAKIFEDVPTLLKIRSGLALRKAKEVIDMIMTRIDAPKNPKFVETNYVADYKYETNDALIEKGLIKITNQKINLGPKDPENEEETQA